MVLDSLKQARSQLPRNLRIHILRAYSKDSKRSSEMQLCNFILLPAGASLWLDERWICACDLTLRVIGVHGSVLPGLLAEELLSEMPELQCHDPAEDYRSFGVPLLHASPTQPRMCFCISTHQKSLGFKESCSWFLHTSMLISFS